MADPPKIQGPQEWLYVLIVGALALYLVIGVIAWSWMILAGIPTPGAFTTTLAAIVGALAGVLSPLKGPPARNQDRAAR